MRIYKFGLHNSNKNRCYMLLVRYLIIHNDSLVDYSNFEITICWFDRISIFMQ